MSVSPVVCSAVYCDLKIKIYTIDSKIVLLVPPMRDRGV